MSESTAMIEEKYRQVYEEELRGLERRCENDPTCTVAELTGLLKSLYVNDGNDWTGRGQLQDAVVAATIAAYEYFIAELKKKNAAP